MNTKKLVVIDNDKELSVGQYLEVEGKQVGILHITMNGFLYNKTASGPHDYVTVTKGKNMTTYYSNWDYLEFVPREVRIVEI